MNKISHWYVDSCLFPACQFVACISAWKPIGGGSRRGDLDRAALPNQQGAALSLTWARYWRLVVSSTLPMLRKARCGPSCRLRSSDCDETGLYFRAHWKDLRRSIYSSWGTLPFIGQSWSIHNVSGDNYLPVHLKPRLLISMIPYKTEVALQQLWHLDGHCQPNTFTSNSTTGNTVFMVRVSKKNRRKIVCIYFDLQICGYNHHNNSFLNLL